MQSSSMSLCNKRPIETGKITIYGNTATQLNYTSEEIPSSEVSCQRDLVQKGVFRKKSETVLKNMSDSEMQNGKRILKNHNISSLSLKVERVGHKRGRPEELENDEGVHEDESEGRLFNIEEIISQPLRSILNYSQPLRALITFDDIESLKWAINNIKSLKDWSDCINVNHGAKFGHRGNKKAPWTKEHDMISCEYRDARDNSLQDAFGKLLTFETSNQFNDIDKWNTDMKLHHFLVNTDYEVSKSSKSFDIKATSTQDAKEGLQTLWKMFNLEYGYYMNSLNPFKILLKQVTKNYLIVNFNPKAREKLCRFIIIFGARCATTTPHYHLSKIPFMAISLSHPNKLNVHFWTWTPAAEFAKKLSSFMTKFTFAQSHDKTTITKLRKEKKVKMLQEFTNQTNSIAQEVPLTVIPGSMAWELNPFRETNKDLIDFGYQMQNWLREMRLGRVILWGTNGRTVSFLQKPTKKSVDFHKTRVQKKKAEGKTLTKEDEKILKMTDDELFAVSISNPIINVQRHKRLVHPKFEYILQPDLWGALSDKDARTVVMRRVNQKMEKDVATGIQAGDFTSMEELQKAEYLQQLGIAFDAKTASAIASLERMQSEEIKALSRRMEDAEFDIANLKNRVDHIEEWKGAASEVMNHNTVLNYTMAPFVMNENNRPIIEPGAAQHLTLREDPNPCEHTLCMGRMAALNKMRRNGVPVRHIPLEKSLDHKLNQAKNETRTTLRAIVKLDKDEKAKTERLNKENKRVAAASKTAQIFRDQHDPGAGLNQKEFTTTGAGISSDETRRRKESGSLESETDEMDWMTESILAMKAFMSNREEQKKVGLETARMDESSSEMSFEIVPDSGLIDLMLSPNPSQSLSACSETGSISTKSLSDCASSLSCEINSISSINSEFDPPNLLDIQNETLFKWEKYLENEVTGCHFINGATLLKIPVYQWDEQVPEGLIASENKIISFRARGNDRSRAFYRISTNREKSRWCTMVLIYTSHTLALLRALIEIKKTDTDNLFVSEAIHLIFGIARMEVRIYSKAFIDKFISGTTKKFPLSIIPHISDTLFNVLDKYLEIFMKHEGCEYDISVSHEEFYLKHIRNRFEALGKTVPTTDRQQSLPKRTSIHLKNHLKATEDAGLEYKFYQSLLTSLPAQGENIFYEGFDFEEEFSELLFNKDIQQKPPSPHESNQNCIINVRLRDKIHLQALREGRTGNNPTDKTCSQNQLQVKWALTKEEFKNKIHIGKDILSENPFFSSFKLDTDILKITGERALQFMPLQNSTIRNAWLPDNTCKPFLSKMTLSNLHLFSLNFNGIKKPMKKFDKKSWFLKDKNQESIPLQITYTNLNKVDTTSLERLVTRNPETSFFLLVELNLNIDRIKDNALTPIGYEWLYHEPVNTSNGPVVYSAILFKSLYRNSISLVYTKPPITAVIFKNSISVNKTAVYLSCFYFPITQSPKWLEMQVSEYVLFERLYECVRRSKGMPAVIAADLNHRLRRPRLGEKENVTEFRCIFNNFVNELQGHTFMRHTKKSTQTSEIDIFMTRGISGSGIKKFGKEEADNDGHVIFQFTTQTMVKNVIGYQTITCRPKLNEGLFRNAALMILPSLKEKLVECYREDNAKLTDDLDQESYTNIVNGHSLDFKKVNYSELLFKTLDELARAFLPEQRKVVPIYATRQTESPQTREIHHIKNNIRMMLKEEDDLFTRDGLIMILRDLKRAWKDSSKVDKALQFIEIYHGPLTKETLFDLNKKINPKNRLLAGRGSDLAIECLQKEYLRVYNKIGNAHKIFNFDMDITVFVKYLEPKLRFSFEEFMPPWKSLDKSFKSVHDCLISLKPTTRGLNSALNRNILLSLPNEFQPLNYKAVKFLLLKGVFPDEWLTTKGKTIPKKGDPNIPENNRFLNIGKAEQQMAMKVAASCCLNFLESRDVLSLEQHGFRPGHGCDLAVASMRLRAALIPKNCTVYGLAIDLSAAFFSPKFEMLLGILRKLCKPSAMKFFESVLRPRKAVLVEKGINSEVYDVPPWGMPQGEPTSPLFFNLCFNGIFSYYKQNHRRDEGWNEPTVSGCHLQGYADDGFLLIWGPDTPTAVKGVQDAVLKCEHFLRNAGFLVNEKKTELIRIDVKERRWQDFQLETSIGTLKIQDKIRLLGLRMKEDLDFQPQIEHIIGQLIGAYRAARNLMMYGTSKATLEVAMSNQLGVTQFGLNIMPELSRDQTNAIQTEINRTIRTVLGIKPREDGTLIPNRELLKVANIMPVNILQIKLALCRLNGILNNEKPAFLNYIVKKLIVYSDGTGYDRKKGQVGYSYNDLLKWGRRDIRLHLPKEFAENNQLDQNKLIKTFPFTCIKWFNNLPVHIRNALLTPRFDILVTAHLKTSCFHRLSYGPYDGCSHCLSTANKTQFDTDRVIYLMKRCFESEENFTKIEMDYEGVDAVLAVADLKLCYGDWQWEEIINGKKNENS